MAMVGIYIKTNYCIISSYLEDAVHLVEKVQELTLDGWVIAGVVSNSSNKLFQALVK